MVTTLSVSWLLLDRILEMSLSSRIPSGCYEICGSALRECRLLFHACGRLGSAPVIARLACREFFGEVRLLGIVFPAHVLVFLFIEIALVRSASRTRDLVGGIE